MDDDRLAAVLARLDRMERAIADLRDDALIAYEAARAARMVGEHTREEARFASDHNSEIFRRIQRLETRVREITGNP